MSTINDIEGYLNMMEGVPQAERVSLLTGEICFVVVSIQKPVRILESY